MRTRGFHLSIRDEDMNKDLYFAPYQTTRQLAICHDFNSEDACKRQLYRLARREIVEPYTPIPGLTIWKLTNWAWARQADAADRRGERNRTWPEPERVQHYVDANDIYVHASPHLDNKLGKYPEWKWLDERRAYRQYNTRNGLRKHQPDAEIRFGGKVYFMERQTHRARKTATDFKERCERYRTYLNHFGFSNTDVALVFACDTERDMRYAREGAKEYGIPHFADTLGEVVEYLKEGAEEAANRMERMEEEAS